MVSWPRGDHCRPPPLASGATSVPERQWVALASHTERAALDGGEVEVLDLDGRLVLLALHAAHHGIGVPDPLSDLRVGLAKTTDTDWSRAAFLARELGAEAALVSGLRLLDEGQALVHRLALDAPSNANLALRAATPPHTALGFERLDEVHERHDRARVIISELVPPPTYMRDWTPVARRGRPRPRPCLPLPSALARMVGTARLPRLAACEARERAVVHGVAPAPRHAVRSPRSSNTTATPYSAAGSSCSSRATPSSSTHACAITVPASLPTPSARRGAAPARPSCR